MAAAALALLQVAIVARSEDSATASRFFVWWTVVLLAAVAIRFGVDQLLPKLAARAVRDNDLRHLQGLRSVLRRTVPAAVPAIAAVLLGLEVTNGSLELAALTASCAVGAACLGACFIFAGLAKGYNNVGLSGVTSGVLPGAAAALSAGVATAWGGGLTALAITSAVGMAAAAAAGIVLAVRMIGREPVRALLGAGPLEDDDRDVKALGAATGVGEAMPWIPVWLATVLELPAGEIEGLYAALRISVVFSWGFTAVVAVATPQMARAFALNRLDEAAGIISKAAVTGIIVTTPVAVCGWLVAGSLLGILDPAFQPLAPALAILIGSRVIDAATGPIAEALVLAGKARWELANQAIGVLSVALIGLLLHPSIGVEGLALGFAGAFALQNAIRVVELRRLLRSEPLATIRPAHDFLVSRTRRLAERITANLRCPAPLLLTAVTVVAAAIATADWGLRAPLRLTAATGLTVAALAVAAAHLRRGVAADTRALVFSPFAIVAATFLLLYVARPLELLAWPRNAAGSLLPLGVERSDLARTAALSAAGCCAWCLGHTLTIWSRRPALVRAGPYSPAAAVVALALGTALWSALFIRQGGPQALLSNPAAIREGQQSSFYGFVGVWIVQAATLISLIAWLQRRARAAAHVTALGAVLTLLAGVCLQVRGLTAAAFLAALAVAAFTVQLKRRHVAVVLVLASLGLPLLLVAQQVRNYSQVMSTSDAIRLLPDTPVSTFYLSDVSTFDNLVAIHDLVPDSVEHLEGETLLNIPGALVPRSLWHGKPQPVDRRVAELLYPGSTAAVPIGLQGELFWNGGVWLVVLGCLLAGSLVGAVGLLRPPVGAGLLLTYSVALFYIFALHTRAIGTMLGNLVLALTGVGIALWICGSPAMRRVFAVWPERARVHALRVLTRLSA